MTKAKEIAQRLASLFLMNALGIITGSAIIAPELEVWKSAALAGCVACFKVAEALARASVDGSLTKDEIDAAFGGNPSAKSKPRRK
jgi:hypothetical protein